MKITSENNSICLQKLKLNRKDQSQVQVLPILIRKAFFFKFLKTFMHVFSEIPILCCADEKLHVIYYIELGCPLFQTILKGDARGKSISNNSWTPHGKHRKWGNPTYQSTVDCTNWKRMFLSNKPASCSWQNSNKSAVLPNKTYIFSLIVWTKSVAN